MIIYAKDDIVSLSGALTKNEWLSIKAAANLLLREHPEGIIVDCGGLGSVTEDGARTFLYALRDIQSADSRIVVANVPDHVRNSIRDVPGVRSRVPLASTVDEARASLRSGATHGPDSQQCVIVPVVEGLNTAEAVAIAADLSKGSNVPLLLLYCLELAYALPLGSPVPDKEAAASRLLEQAVEDARRLGVAPITHIEQVRDLREGLLHEIEKHNASLLVISANADRFADSAFGALVESLLTKASCNVLIARSRFGGVGLAGAPLGATVGADRRKRESGIEA